jgi:hypothetical protein
MPAIQSQFEAFHCAIKLDEDDEKAKLREKRKTLLDALQSRLPDEFPSFEHFNQGSYSMDTGVMPVDGNFDIDVGIIFKCAREEYSDPVTLKIAVRDALDTHGRDVKIRRPCVTANYIRNGEIDFHVDLAIYAQREDGLLDLAKGKEHSTDSNRYWEIADPKGLTQEINNAFFDKKEREQYRRCIRYLKRWRDVNFVSGGAPLSIALTVAAKKWFKPYFELSDKPTDLLALLNWVETLLANFRFTLTNEGYYSKIEIILPVTPYTDLMGWMNKSQMETFLAKLEFLKTDLSKAYNEELPEEASKILNKQFGADFKILDKAATARVVPAAVISTGNSA